MDHALPKRQPGATLTDKDGTEESEPDIAPPADGSPLDLAYRAWTIIANAYEGDWNAARADWREAAERWRDEFHAALAREADTSDAPMAPAGEHAEVQIMGHDARIGWVTDGSLAGGPCLDVRDDAGRLIAKIPPHSVYLYQPVLPPGALRPRQAIDGPRCICGPVLSSNGGDIDERPDCPVHDFGEYGDDDKDPF